MAREKKVYNIYMYVYIYTKEKRSRVVGIRIIKINVFKYLRIFLVFTLTIIYVFLLAFYAVQFTANSISPILLHIHCGEITA